MSEHFTLHTSALLVIQRQKYFLSSSYWQLTTAVKHNQNYYGRPLSVSGRPCYVLPMFFFISLFFYGRLAYSPALVNGGSRKFYTWWTLSVIRKVSTWIFSWSPLNYRVGQKVTKFGVFSDPTRKLSALTPKCGGIL